MWSDPTVASNKENAINKSLRYLLAVSAVALAAFPAEAGFANPIALPTNVVSALRKSAPVLVSPMPAAKVEKICPVMSETRLSPDKSLAVTLVDGPFCLTAVSKNGKAVELSVPVKPGASMWSDPMDALDNVVVKGFDVKDLFSADDERRLSDHRIVGCVIEMRR